MGCASSTEAKADQPRADGPRNPPGDAGKQKEARREEREEKPDPKSKAKLLDPELVSLAAPGLVHEQYTFDQGGTLGASWGHNRWPGLRRGESQELGVSSVCQPQSRWAQNARGCCEPTTRQLADQCWALQPGRCCDRSLRARSWSPA